MASNFAAYLASLGTGTTLTPFTPLPDSSSPTKRARSDSPDFPLSSPDHTTYFSLSPTTPLRSILSHPSSPHSSPPLSRALSRRSSSSHKSVRFARCTNASVFPAHSGVEYDRTSIVPTCQAESLQLPAREEAEGWIKCVERERAAKARLEGKRCMPRAVEKPVEGVHGLIEGGYFVGEERDEVDEEEEVDDDAMVVDDEEESAEVEGEESMPALVRDDSSGDDSDGVLSVASDVALPLPSSSSPHPPPSLGFGVMERTVTITVEELEEEERAKNEREEQRKTKCRERYGLCALGKYSRAEVFQSYDSLGGF